MNIQVTNINSNRASFKAGVNIKTRKPGLYKLLGLHADKMEGNSTFIRVVGMDDFKFEPDNFGLPDKEGFYTGYLCDDKGGALSISSRSSSLIHSLRMMAIAEGKGNKTAFRSSLDHYLEMLEFCNGMIKGIRAKAPTVTVESIEDIRKIKGFESFL